MSSIPLVALSVRPTATPQDLQAQQMQLRNLAGQNAMIPGQLQQQQQAIQQQQGAIAAQQQENQMRAMQLKSQQGLQKTLSEWDSSKDSIDDFPARAAANGVMPADIKPYIDLQTALQTRQKDQLDFLKQKQGMVTDGLESVLSSPDEQLAQTALGKLNELGQIGALDSGHVQQGMQIIQQFQNDPAGLRQHLQTYEKENGLYSQMIDNAAKRATAQKTTSEEFKEIPDTGIFYNPGTGETKTAAGAPLVSKVDLAEMTDWLAKNPGKGPADFMAYKAKLVPQFNFNLQQNALQGNARDMAAENYFQTGQLPAGMRSPAMSAAIITRAAQLHPDAVGDLAGNRAAYEANKKSYDNVTGTLDTLSAFESSANKNMDQFLALTKKLPDTGVPWINTPVRNLNQNLVGAEWMPAINAARSVMDREIARVTNDPKLSGSLTDSARAEVSGLNPANATLPQIVHLTQTLRNDMANVHSSLAQQKADIGNRLQINPTSSQAGGNQQNAGAATSGPPAGATHTGISSVDGKKYWLDANGKKLGPAQ